VIHSLGVFLAIPPWVELPVLVGVIFWETGTVEGTGYELVAMPQARIVSVPH
jgi:hypothetical protein